MNINFENTSRRHIISVIVAFNPGSAFYFTLHLQFAYKSCSASLRQEDQTRKASKYIKEYKIIREEKKTLEYNQRLQLEDPKTLDKEHYVTKSQGEHLGFYLLPSSFVGLKACSPA